MYVRCVPSHLSQSSSDIRRLSTGIRLWDGHSYIPSCADSRCVQFWNRSSRQPEAIFSEDSQNHCGSRLPGSSESFQMIAWSGHHTDLMHLGVCPFLNLIHLFIYLNASLKADGCLSSKLSRNKHPVPIWFHIGPMDNEDFALVLDLHRGHSLRARDLDHESQQPTCTGRSVVCVIIWTNIWVCRLVVGCCAVWDMGNWSLFLLFPPENVHSFLALLWLNLIGYGWWGLLEKSSHWKEYSSHGLQHTTWKHTSQLTYLLTTLAERPIWAPCSTPA